ncbi:MAG TPA: AsmA family protein [Terriglobia bacterium]|nr:AsmA family protein [Terriglobia bacterium]
MANRGKSILKKFLIAFAILIAILLILPWFIHVDRYRPEIISEIERVTGRRVELGRLSVRFLPKISVVVQDFSLGNPPGFPSGNFITATAVSANLAIGPLLHHRLVAGSIQIKKPVIMLVSKGEQWNFASPPMPAIRNASYSISFQATVKEIVISDAHMMLAHVLPSGEISPASLEAMDATIDLKSVSLGGPVTSTFGSSTGLAPGISYRLASLHAGGDFQSTSPPQVTAHGSLAVKTLRFNQVNLTNLKSNLALDPARLSLNPISFDTLDGKGKGDFQMDLAHPNSPYQLSLNLTAVNVAKLLAAFEGGNGKMTGTANADCRFSGDFAGSADPWIGKHVDGNLTILRGRVPDLKLSKDILQMMKIVGIGPTTGDISSFSSLSADFELRDGLLSSRTITLFGNGLNATGQGSTDLNRAPDPTLNYQGVAQIKAARTPLANALSSLVQVPIRNGMVDLRFHVNGTLNQPKFVVEPPPGLAPLLGGGANRNQATPNPPPNLIQGIMGLFGKKAPAKK